MVLTEEMPFPHKKMNQNYIFCRRKKGYPMGHTIIIFCCWKPRKKVLLWILLILGKQIIVKNELSVIIWMVVERRLYYWRKMSKNTCHILVTHLKIYGLLKYNTTLQQKLAGYEPIFQKMSKRWDLAKQISLFSLP